MANKFRSLIKVITGHINKDRLYNNATSAIGNATERAQEKLINMQSLVASKYDTITKQINNETTIFQDLNSAHLQPSTPLPKRIIKWWQWYQRITGLDTVEMSKDQVIRAQDKLFKCQDERRILNRQVAILNEKLKEVYGELVQTKRDDPRYVQLTIVENKSLQEQAKIMSQLNLLEKEERDHFTLLATAIKEYHDSQTMNAQKYKYLSILASALLAIISLAGSMVYNNKRIADVRNVIAQAQEKNQSLVADGFHSLENKVNEKFAEVMEKLQEKTPVPLSPAPVIEAETKTQMKNVYLPPNVQNSFVVATALILTVYFYNTLFG